MATRNGPGGGKKRTKRTPAQIRKAGEQVRNDEREKRARARADNSARAKKQASDPSSGFGKGGAKHDGSNAVTDGIRVCEATTVLGKACRGRPFAEGEDVQGVEVSGRWCRAHDPDIPDTARIAGRQPGAGRPPRVGSPLALLRDAIETDPLLVLRPYLRAAGLDIEVHREPGGKIRLQLIEGSEAVKIWASSKDGDIFVSTYDDLEGMMKAVERLLDRVYGKPKQGMEIAVDAKQAAPKPVPKTPERAAAVASILDSTGALGKHGGRRRSEPSEPASKPTKAKK